jgi:hypothetical protein
MICIENFGFQFHQSVLMLKFWQARSRQQSKKESQILGKKEQNKQNHLLSIVYCLQQKWPAVQCKAASSASHSHSHEICE